MTSPSTDSMVAEYRDAAVRHGSAKTARAANAAAEKIAALYREFRQQGEQAALLPLLTDPRSSVRSWAAAHALEFAPEQAVPVLEALASGPPGAQRANASMTLREWRAGRLKFP